jgi:hypothetical protein
MLPNESIWKVYIRVGLQEELGPRVSPFRMIHHGAPCTTMLD